MLSWLRMQKAYFCRRFFAQQNLWMNPFADPGGWKTSRQAAMDIKT